VTPDPGDQPGRPPDDVFRTEALAYFADRHGPGELLRVSSVWDGWAFWGLLALVAAGLLATLLVQVNGEPLLYLFVPSFRH